MIDSSDQQNRSQEQLLPFSVLVIENDDGVRASVTMILQSWSITVIDSPSIEICKKSFKQKSFSPNLILTDLKFGCDSCKCTLNGIRLLMEDMGYDGPVIVMSGDSAAASRQQVEACGWLFLLKPFAMPLLRASVLHAVGRR